MRAVQASAKRPIYGAAANFFRNLEELWSLGSKRSPRARARGVCGLGAQSSEFVCVPSIYMSGVKDKSQGCAVVAQEPIGTTLWSCRTIIREFLDKPVIQTWST